MLNEMIKFLDQRFSKTFYIKSSSSTALEILGQVFGGYVRGCQISYLLTHRIYGISEKQTNEPYNTKPCTRYISSCKLQNLLGQKKIRTLCDAN